MADDSEENEGMDSTSTSSGSSAFSESDSSVHMIESSVENSNCKGMALNLAIQKPNHCL